jgi:phenylalanyl-tRNA synthetase beta chain
MAAFARYAGKQMLQMTVRPETAMVRPFVVCAVLRGVRFDPARYNSFIDLQASRASIDQRDSA